MDEHEWRKRVGDPMARRRKELGLSVRQAAAQAGVSESQWRQVEAGRRPVKGGEYEPVSPKEETLAAMSPVLGWAPAAGITMLIEGKRPRPIDPAERAAIEARRARPSGDVEARLAQLEDEVRSLMRIVLQIQSERVMDERLDSHASDEARRSAP